MKISTLLITSAISLSITSVSFAQGNTKLCAYSSCTVQKNIYSCSQIVNGNALDPAIRFSPNMKMDNLKNNTKKKKTSSKNKMEADNINREKYSVVGKKNEYPHASCSATTGKSGNIREKTATCHLRINSNDPCSLQ